MLHKVHHKHQKMGTERIKECLIIVNFPLPRLGANCPWNVVAKFFFVTLSCIRRISNNRKNCWERREVNRNAITILDSGRDNNHFSGEKN